MSCHINIGTIAFTQQTLFLVSAQTKLMWHMRLFWFGARGGDGGGECVVRGVRRRQKTSAVPLLLLLLLGETDRQTASTRTHGHYTALRPVQHNATNSVRVLCSFEELVEVSVGFCVPWSQTHTRTPTQEWATLAMFWECDKTARGREGRSGHSQEMRKGERKTTIDKMRDKQHSDE